MIFVIIAAVLVSAAVAAFVWTAVRSGVRQVITNRADSTDTVASWWEPVDPSHTPAGYAPDGLGDTDEPVTYWPTYTDPRTSAPVDLGRGYDELNAATGGRGWEELKHRCY